MKENYTGQCIITNQEAIARASTKQQYNQNLVRLLIAAGAPIAKFNVAHIKDLATSEVVYEIDTEEYEWEMLHEPKNGRMIFKWKKK